MSISDRFEGLRTSQKHQMLIKAGFVYSILGDTYRHVYIKAEITTEAVHALTPQALGDFISKLLGVRFDVGDDPDPTQPLWGSLLTPEERKELDHWIERSFEMPKCECGSERAGITNLHATYCPKYKDPMKGY